MLGFLKGDWPENGGQKMGECLRRASGARHRRLY
jgi:hypothetical protein